MMYNKLHLVDRESKNLHIAQGVIEKTKKDLNLTDSGYYPEQKAMESP